MRTIQSIVLLSALAASAPSRAHRSRSEPPASPDALAILTHLDLASFPNSAGPRRRPPAHTPADYGLTRTERFPDGWAQSSMPDDSWHMGAVLLQRGKGTVTICFTDSAGGGGTYRSVQALQVTPDRHAYWAVRVMAARPDCQAALPLPRMAPAAMLQRLDDFRDSLVRSDRLRLDRLLPRSRDGGIAQCDQAEGSMASCKVDAYIPALRRARLASRFLATLAGDRIAERCTSTEVFREGHQTPATIPYALTFSADLVSGYYCYDRCDATQTYPVDNPTSDPIKLADMHRDGQVRVITFDRRSAILTDYQVVDVIVRIERTAEARCTTTTYHPPTLLSAISRRP